MIITLDGPSGSGKGAIAKELAKQLNCWHLDSGLLYRACAYLDLSVPHISLSQLLAECILDCDRQSGETLVFYQKEILNPVLRTETIAQRASQLAAEKTIRDLLLEVFRVSARNHEMMIADGRDMGSVVFPHAAIKYYIDASLDTRAFRRYQDLKLILPETTLDEVKKSLAERDHRDKNRAFGALICPPEAIVINTEQRSACEIAKEISQHVDKYQQK